MAATINPLSLKLHTPRLKGYFMLCPVFLTSMDVRNTGQREAQGAQRYSSGEDRKNEVNHLKTSLEDTQKSLEKETMQRINQEDEIQSLKKDDQ
ncbi:hypothetical protein EAG_04092 [Camponotus floridanus]|uniref:Uncharacterized protein n=1 Tax=Camponotus floridanus TaxID=104421 RepID=E1ZV94_CAMFO|nr:hypothetical protein EAG_04092 [Camponotus floridanus]